MVTYLGHYQDSVQHLKPGHALCHTAITCLALVVTSLLLLFQVTHGPNAGKLALLDFGLVAEVPAADREAMVSATIHLGNR